MANDTLKNGTLAVAGGVGAALVGGYLSPNLSPSVYTPAIVTGVLGACWLGFTKKSPLVGYGALAAAGVLALGGVALAAAQADVAKAKSTATAGNLRSSMVAGNLVPAPTGRAAQWASDHAYADRKMRAMGIR